MHEKKNKINSTLNKRNRWYQHFMELKVSQHKKKKTQVCFCFNGGKLSKKKYIKRIVLQYPP